MSKNTHLEHLEDSILLDGEQGAKDAFMFLDELARVFTGVQKNNFKITTKWDGAPAVFCGLYPGTDKFFVGTKSVFNVNAKINFTNEDVDHNHGNSPGLVSKLKDCLKYLPELGIKGIAQGDLLFTDDKKEKNINGTDCILFQPNTITYCIPKEDELYGKASKAKLGVVFHTKYTGNSIENMNASFGYDVSQLNDSKNVLVLSAETGQLGADTLLTEREKNSLSKLKTTSQTSLGNASKFLDEVAEQIKTKDQLVIGTRLKIFFNKYVREGKKLPSDKVFVKEFQQYFETEVKKAADKVKTPKAKAAKLTKLYDGLDMIKDHEKALKSTVNLYSALQSAKELFIRKLEKGERFGTYLRTENGYKITAPEGYVAIQDGNNAVKLVDRLSFSVANFNVEKNWVAGDKPQ
tara:strand:+ start:12623 stop:13843 length:1221 start_codon:yes stop_codon:yes gene_type:complete